MENPTFIIDPADLPTGQRYAIQGIAAKILHDAGVLPSETEDRSPYDILADMPDIPGADDAKVRMMSVMAGLSIDQA